MDWKLGGGRGTDRGVGGGIQEDGQPCMRRNIQPRPVDVMVLRDSDVCGSVWWPSAATLGERPFIRVGEHFTAEVERVEGSTIFLKVHAPIGTCTRPAERNTPRQTHTTLPDQSSTGMVTCTRV